MNGWMELVINSFSQNHKEMWLVFRNNRQKAQECHEYFFWLGCVNIFSTATAVTWIMKCQHTPCNPPHAITCFSKTDRCALGWIHMPLGLLQSSWVICVEQPSHSHTQPANKNPNLYLRRARGRHRVNRHFPAMWEHMEHMWSISVRVKGRAQQANAATCMFGLGWCSEGRGST